MTPQRTAGTILVTDDDFEVRDYFQAALESQGFLVQLAEDGEEALRQVERWDQSASLVLLDVMLPGMDGVETFKRIRSIHRDVPIILISSRDSWPWVGGWRFADADARKSATPAAQSGYSKGSTWGQTTVTA